jgi:hypothetical protein
MEIITPKQELIDCISTIEDKETLLILQGIMHHPLLILNNNSKKDFL